jgi:hypothetical protein
MTGTWKEEGNAAVIKLEELGRGKGKVTWPTTAGELHDIKGHEALTNESASDPKVLLANRGNDTYHVRADAEEGGGVPIIPTKKNRRRQIRRFVSIAQEGASECKLPLG